MNQPYSGNGKQGWNGGAFHSEMFVNRLCKITVTGKDSVLLLPPLYLDDPKN